MLFRAVSVVASEPLANAIFSIGTTTTNALGASWAYVLWQPTQPTALAGHKIAIYGKAGDAASANNYTRLAITQRQIDPLVIESLLGRAANIGEDLALLEYRINAMFAAAVPSANLTLAQKISAVIRGSEKDPQLLANVIFLGRLHPALNLCLGHAWAEPMSPPGKTTFEIRDFDVTNGKDLGVIGRVTLDPASPIVLPAPGMPVQYNEANAKGDLNIKLRWATPVSLREVGLLQHGFNLYRMPKAFAEMRNFHVTPPEPEELRELVIAEPANVKQINETPITVNKLYDATSAADYAADSTWYVADDNHRYQPFGVPFVNGEEFYYFATARDLLGRDGFVSPGGLAIACDRVPPDAPVGVQVENLYTFNLITGTQQVLRVKWKQAPNTGEVVSAYYVYRWTNATDASTFGVTNPALNRIAGPIPHANGQTYGSYIDKGPGSPQVPADYGKTYWYTVRAVDTSVCTNNLSPNSAPAFGVLRNRTAPGEPTGHLDILCCRPNARTDKDLFTDDATASDTNLAFYRFTVARTNGGLGFAEFYFTVGTQTNLIARQAFPPGTAPLVFNWITNRAFVGGGSHRTFCRVIAKDDKESALIEGSNNSLPPFGARHDVNFLAWIDCQRVRMRPDPFGGGGCTEHTPVNPDDGESIEPPIVIFLPAPGSKEFRLYRRVNFGPMTLIKQGPVTNDPPVDIPCPDPNPPANAGFLCYYVQCLDEHGNAGPLTQIDECLRFKLPNPKPLLSPLVAEGDENAPEMTVSWFCPPFGVERFEIYIAPGSGNSMPPDLASNLAPSSVAQPVTKWVKVGKTLVEAPHDFFIYRTPRVGPQFGDGGFFQVSAKVELNRNYLVFIKPIGLDGQPDPDSQNSKVEKFIWSAPVVQGPKVPWPARPLPAVNTNTFPPWVKPVFINNTNLTTNFVGVGIIVGVTGRPGRGRESLNTPAVIDGNDSPMTWIASSQAGDNLFPLVAYRFQETNSFFPDKVSGDIVQVTPMMNAVAYTVGNDVQFGTSALIYDPFIDVYSASLLGVPELGVGAAARNALVLLDTQPVLVGARYRYVLVRFGENGEIAEAIPTASVEIQ